MALLEGKLSLEAFQKTPKETPAPRKPTHSSTTSPVAIPTRGPSETTPCGATSGFANAGTCTLSIKAKHLSGLNQKRQAKRTQTR